MALQNYSAWNAPSKGPVVGASPREVMQRLVEYAVLSASGHNAQPWRARFSGAELLVEADPDRILRHGGVDGAEPHVSLGAFVETLCLAGRGLGLAIDHAYDDQTAVVRLNKEIPNEAGLLDAIVSRVSDRSEFSTKPLPQGVPERISGEGVDGAAVTWVTDPEQIDFVASQTEVATREIMAVSEFRRELSQWVRNNRTRKFDGMPGFTQGMPTPPSFIAPLIIRIVDIGKQQARTDSNRVRASSALAILRSTAGTPSAMFATGRLYTRIAVRAQLEGLASSAVASSVVSPSSSARVASEFGISDIPVTVLRLGVSSAVAPRSPRRPSEHVIS